MVGRGKTFPGSSECFAAGAGKTLFQRLQHDQHGSDTGVMLPPVKIPGLIDNPTLQIGLAGGWSIVGQCLAELSGTGAGGVGEVAPCLPFDGLAGLPAQVPVQQEQRGQALLAIQGIEGAVHDIAIDEIQADGTVVMHDGIMQGVDEVLADSLHRCAMTALCIVALDQRDFDSLDSMSRLQVFVEE